MIKILSIYFKLYISGENVKYLFMCDALEILNISRCVSENVFANARIPAKTLIMNLKKPLYTNLRIAAKQSSV